MQEIHFQSLDLNLLRVFDTLAEERSVTRAGERLGLTQSAISHALNRLRFAFKDELFVRAPEGMQPTPRAAEVWPDVRRGLVQLQHALAPTEFDPAEAERAFNIAASPYFCEVLLPRAVARVRAEAPNVELHIRSPYGGVADALETGRLDLAVGLFGRATEVFSREFLFEEGLVWVLRADHPVLDDPAPLDRLMELPLLVLAPSDDEPRRGDRANRGIERLSMWEELNAGRHPMGPGARQRVKVVMDNAHAALAITARTDIATLAPRRLAMTWREVHNLKILDLPAEMAPPNVGFEMIWRTDQGVHPAHIWLRTVIRETAQDA
jgi:DNA-binding transcriptional LysR family regulator